MKKNNKLTILSLLTSAVILTSTVPVDKTTNSYVSSYYDVLLEDLTSEYSLIDENVNFVPEGNYVPQGISLVNDYVITSSFDYYKEKKSKLCIYDKDGKIVNECLLDHNAHVGGIVYDEEHQLLWVTTFYGNISAYDIDDVFTKTNVVPKYKDLNVGNQLPNYVYPWVNSASFLTIYNNELYVGNFSIRNDGRIKKYSIEEKDNKITLKYIGYFKIPDMVQGVTFYKKDNKEYIMFSRSYGRDCPSILQMFKYDRDVTDYRANDLVSVPVKMTPMLEQIICEDGKIYSLFESNAKPYVSSQDTEFDSIPVIDAQSIVKKLELKIDTN